MNFTLTKDGHYAMVLTKAEFEQIRIVISEEQQLEGFSSKSAPTEFEPSRAIGSKVCFYR